MKLTKTKLKQIIKEELEKILSEAVMGSETDPCEALLQQYRDCVKAKQVAAEPAAKARPAEPRRPPQYYGDEGGGVPSWVKESKNK